jgi:deoxyadenosine/deoxycytidine kinase
MPAFFFQLKRDRWFNWTEIRAMVYLKAWYFIVSHRKFSERKVIILDHGPIFRLAFLDEFGPRFSKNFWYKKWWNNTLESWLSMLDAIVWLNATDEILFGRIQSRDRWHEVKEKENEVAFDYLQRYKDSCKKIISKVTDDQKILEFDTTINSADQIKEDILKMIDLVQTEYVEKDK